MQKCSSEDEQRRTQTTSNVLSVVGPSLAAAEVCSVKVHDNLLPACAEKDEAGKPIRSHAFITNIFRVRD